MINTLLLGRGKSWPYCLNVRFEGLRKGLDWCPDAKDFNQNAKIVITFLIITDQCHFVT